MSSYIPAAEKMEKNEGNREREENVRQLLWYRSEWISVQLTKVRSMLCSRAIAYLYRIFPCRRKLLTSWLGETPRNTGIHQARPVISVLVAIHPTGRRKNRIWPAWPAASRLYALYRAEVAFRDCSTGLTLQSSVTGRRAVSVRGCNINFAILTAEDRREYWGASGDFILSWTLCVLVRPSTLPATSLESTRELGDAESSWEILV